MDEESGGGIPEWVLTFGDMMSLLLCFFILLFSLSEAKREDQQNAVIESILRQFGDQQAIATFSASQMMNRHVEDPGQTVDAVEQLNPSQRKKADSGGRSVPGRNRRVQTIRDGRRLTVGGPVLFEEGKADLIEPAQEALRAIADSVRGKTHILEVRGFEPLGGLPSNSTYHDATDLAYARTRAVVDFLVDQGGIKRNRIRMALAAPMEAGRLPTMDNGEPMDERVDIIALESYGKDYGRGGAPTDF